MFLINMRASKEDTIWQAIQGIVCWYGPSALFFNCMPPNGLAL
jgi:hypothetical protein